MSPSETARTTAGNALSWIIVAGNVPTYILGLSHIRLMFNVLPSHGGVLDGVWLISTLVGPTLPLGTLLLAILAHLFARPGKRARRRINLSIAISHVIISAIYLMGR